VTAPNLERLKAKLHNRLEANRRKRERGERAHSDSLVKRQEERATLAEAAKRAYADRVDRLCDEFRPFRLLMRTLDREVKETELIEIGVVDLDLPYLLTSLGVHKLPLNARQMAVSEVHEFIRKVHRRKTGSVVTCNVERLFEKGWLDSLDETKRTLMVH